MIPLIKPEQKLRIKLGASPTNQMDWVCGFIDDTNYNSTNGTTNGTSVVNMASGIPQFNGPFTGVRKIQYITVENKDIAPQIVHIIFFNGSDSRTMMKITLAVDNTLHYDEAGWYVTDDDGSITNIQISAIAIGDEVLGATPPALLYTNSLGNLDNSIFLQESDGITIPDGKVFRSATADKSQIDFGAGGDEFNYSNDGATLADCVIIIRTGLNLWQMSTYGAIEVTSSLMHITHDTLVDIDTVAAAPIQIGTHSSGLTDIGNVTGNVRINLPTFANDGAAGAGGLTTGMIYIETATNYLKSKT